MNETTLNSFDSIFMQNNVGSENPWQEFNVEMFINGMKPLNIFNDCELNEWKQFKS